MTIDFNRLKEDIAAIPTVEKSAEALIEAVAFELTTLYKDPIGVSKLAHTLLTERSGLAVAVAATPH